MSENSTSDPTAVRHPHGLPTEIQPQNIPDTVMNTMIDETGARAPFPMPEIPGLKPVTLLGHGGMGIVWLAEQLSTGRKVAVKLIRSGAAMAGGPMQRARFQREIELAARLEHPNIARVFDGGDVEDCPYCVMEYVEGRQLTDFARENDLGRDEIIALMEKIADAVDHAHRRGVLHRDLKPGNIMVTNEGEPKLLDFGLARAMDGTQQTLTIEGALAGTPAYMSPEQARGETSSIDTRSDVYSLGVIFYELLTRRHPYPVDGPLERVLANVSSAVVERPRAHNRSIPPDLEMLLLHSLAAQPADRYASAGELAEDIRRFQRREPLLAGKTSTAYFVRKWAARNRTACLAVATLLATATGATAYHWRSIGIEKDAALMAERQALEAMGRALLSAIEESMQSGNFRGALESIEKAEKSGSVDPGILLFHRIEAMEALGDQGFVKLIAHADRDNLSPSQAARLDFWKAERLLFDGKQKEAFAKLKEALESGDLPEVESALARASLSATVAEAITHYTEAARLAPWRAVTQRNLLIALVLTGRVDEAKARLGLCRLLFPDDDSLLALESLIEALRGDTEGALQVLAKMKDPKGHFATIVRDLVVPIAAISRDSVGIFCSAKSESGIREVLALGKVAAKVKLATMGSADAPSFQAGPAVARSLGGILDALMAGGMGGIEVRRDKVRQALQKSDDAFIWLLLSATEMEMRNYEEALAMALNAQSRSSVFSQVRAASFAMEGFAETMIWNKTLEPGPLARAHRAFKAFYETDLPKDSVCDLALGVAVKAEDLIFARQVAATLPKDGVLWLDGLARIEWADGNYQKAIAYAERGASRFPKDGRFRQMLEQMRKALPEAQDPAGKAE